MTRSTASLTHQSHTFSYKDEKPGAYEWSIGVLYSSCKTTHYTHNVPCKSTAGKYVAPEHKPLLLPTAILVIHRIHKAPSIVPSKVVLELQVVVLPRTTVYHMQACSSARSVQVPAHHSSPTLHSQATTLVQPLTGTTTSERVPPGRPFSFDLGCHGYRDTNRNSSWNARPQSAHCELTLSCLCWISV